MEITFDDYAAYAGMGLTVEEMEQRIMAKRSNKEEVKAFNPFAFKMILSPERKDKMKMPPKPVKKSRYAQQLFEIGAGWDE
ncbi:hypothetical protein [Paraliobacillus ryukyuensis]|uniref:hypothetical protein n=1 Tax=Paraliobacillus ryukyuensis TaxID=200904 RepID=UPI0009A86DC4|nr:hypothetical protein [Paraliobacillus ryukyuensis]